jgi:hypothetical protein
MEIIDLQYPRGDTVPLSFYVNGDCSAKKLRFRLFADKDINADGLLDINSQNYGGDLGELVAVYDSLKKRSRITITPKREYTENKSEQVYYYSLTAVPLEDDNKKETICVGVFVIMWSGENIYNGIPEVPEKILPIFPSAIGEGNFVKIVDGVPVGFSLDNVINKTHEHKSYLHELSQLDIDNKYIEATYLHDVNDLSTIQVWLESSLIKLVYLVDYSIQNDRIIFDGLDALPFLKLGRQLRIFY